MFILKFCLKIPASSRRIINNLSYHENSSMMLIFDLSYLYENIFKVYDTK
jgi:hypothetical protein